MVSNTEKEGWSPIQTRRTNYHHQWWSARYPYPSPIPCGQPGDRGNPDNKRGDVESASHEAYTDPETMWLSVSVSGGGRRGHFGGTRWTTPPSLDGGEWRPAASAITQARARRDMVDGGQSHARGKKRSRLGLGKRILTALCEAQQTG